MESRSYVRIKVLALWAIGLSCWLSLRFLQLGDLAKFIAVVIFGLVSISFYFVHCERCLNPLISLLPWKFGGYWRAFMPEKRCPKCGIERF
jgi:hypothetical protein